MFPFANWGWDSLGGSYEAEITAGLKKCKKVFSRPEIMGSRAGDKYREIQGLPRKYALLALHDLVDYGFAAFIHRNDLVNRRIAGEGNVDHVVAGVEHDVDR
jgi:hypothetical protein